MSNGSLPSLATPDDIVARLGRNLNQVEAARVDAMLQDGSAIIRSYANKAGDFVLVVGDVVTVAADAGVIVLPHRPVVSVDNVVARSGVASIPSIKVTWCIFDGIDKVTVGEPGSSGVINLPEYWYEGGWYNNTFDITYTHGYTSVPPEVKALLCGAIISELSTPTMSATVQSESIGPYSYSMRRAATAGAGIFAALHDFGMSTTLKKYRREAATIAVRM